MTDSNPRCPRCGTELPERISNECCPKCLLEIGLESGTDFSLGDLAETLPHRGEQSTNREVELKNDPAGLKRFRDLQALHDWSGGTVYRAFHEGLQRFVLLRVLESSADDDARRDFLSRAEKLSRVNHAHTAATLEAGVDHGVAYVAEEWSEGKPVEGFLPRSARQRWAEGFYPNAELIRIMRDAASGLDAIHQAGITHDRINPGAIVIDNGGIAKLIGLGEASESSDDRFAMPPNFGAPSAQLANSKCDDAPKGPPKPQSDAADLFRFGATFCFLTTGMLPNELDQKLEAHALAQALKQRNPGLRSDLCRVIAGCVALGGSPAAVSSHRIDSRDNRDDSKENPYQLISQANPAHCATAADVASELSRLLQSDIRRVAWRTRFYSAHLEALGCLLIAGLAYSALAERYENRWQDMPVSLTLSAYLFPLLYAIVLETLLGWTFVRRLFAMRLFDHAGDPAVWWRRCWRSLQKSVLLVLLIALPGLILPLLPLLDGAGPAALIVLPILTLLLPAMGLYLPSRWIPSRWTTYDLAAGVTWGEETQSAATGVADKTTTATRPSRLSAPTRVIDQYELYESLGSGGMGQVFRGRDRVLGRDVAIKLLSGSLIENPLLLERFQREARLAAKVNHPGVAKVFGNGIWNAAPYIAMELVPGSNLQQRIKDVGQLPLDTAWDFATQASEALAAADRSGVVHRDVKPANLMVTDDGHLKVTDFGVSRHVGLATGHQTQEISNQTMTDVGAIVGTPAYMAPEQAMGKDVDRRCDIYALGMTLYHMLSGHPPFKASNAMEMLAQQMTEVPLSLLGKVDGLTPEQWEVIERMIAKQPEQRYGSYDQLIGDLKRHAPGIDRLASPVKRIAAQLTHWVAGYIAFTLIILLTFLIRLRVNFGQYDSTTAFGYLMLLVFVGCSGWLVVSAAKRGSTPGKRLLGLRIVRPDGRPIGIWRSFVRLVVSYPLVVIYFPRMIYYVIARAPGPPLERHLILSLVLVQVGITLASIVMLWTRSDRRTLHDLVAGTMVVRDDRSD